MIFSVNVNLKNYCPVRNLLEIGLFSELKPLKHVAQIKTYDILFLLL